MSVKFSRDDGPVVVVGATGRLGSHLIEDLTRAGRGVRAVSRRPRAERPGVTAYRADVHDTRSLRAALLNAQAIFLNLPPTLQERDLVLIGTAIARAEIATTVLLSSALVGSHPASALAASHEREERVLGAVLGDSLTVLRPGMFMDNDATEWSATIRDEGVVITSFPDSLQLPIAPADIAAAALAALVSPTRGPTRPRRLFGPEWLSARDRAQVLAEVLKRPITIREIAPEAHVALLAQARPAAIARQKVTMLGAAPRSVADCPELPTPNGRTPYSVWAAVNATAFNGGGR